MLTCSCFWMPLKFPKGNHWKDYIVELDIVAHFSLTVCSIDFQGSVSLYMTYDIPFT